MPESFRVIVVGAGGIADAWFPNLLAEGVRVAAVVDLRPEAAAARIEKYQLAGTRIVGDLSQALRDVPADFVLDLTIPAAHRDVTVQSLRAGLPVLGEKPMATNMNEAREMVAASEAAGKLYMVSQSRRWNGHHATLAKAVREKVAGELTALHCDFFLAAHFGGFRDAMPSPLVLDMAIHHFDLARMIGGADPVAVYCEEFNPAGSWYQGDAAAHALFEMTGGVRFAYRGSWCAEGTPTSWNGDWRVQCARGCFTYANDAAPVGVVVDRDEGFQRPTTPAALEPVPVEHREMRGALREMLQHLRDGTQPQTHCRDNIKSLAMVEMALKSSREKRRVRLDEV